MPAIFGLRGIPAPPSSMLKKLILIAFVLGIAAVGAGYYKVDQQVKARLTQRSSELIPAVYSDQIQVTSGTRLTGRALEEELLARSYRSSSGRPKQPGEYRVEGAVFEVVTRPFMSPDGSIKESVTARFDSASQLVQNLTWPEAETFYLEPKVVAPLGGSDRRASLYKSLDEIPEHIRKAILTVEDERFYSHYGIDLYGVSRAIVKNIMAGAIVEGGSSITQQLAKNMLFSPEKTLLRKVKEALAAISLERHLSKEQILELYLNEVYLGQEGSVALHGVAEASSAFFGKSLEETDLADAALLAGIIKAPSYFAPRRHAERAEERRNLVLKKMLDAQVIGKLEYEAARRKPLSITSESRYKRKAPFFVAALEKQIEESFGFEPASVAGMSIYTGLDGNMQTCAEMAVEMGIADLEKRHPRLAKGKPFEAALVALEPHSGLVKAWVGGRDFSVNQFNHVSQAKRQVGSTIKPFLYLTALDPALNTYKTATPISILSDEPMRIDLVTKTTWTPENYDRTYRGDVTLRYALENSLNIPAVSVAQKVGIPALASTLEKFHVSQEIPSVPALALGAAETTLLDLTAAYGALANGGIYTSPRLFITVQERSGEVLAKSAIVEERAADENAVFVLTNLLQGVIERGTGRNIRNAGYTGPAAGKTGTTNDTRDAWFVGFTASLTVGVWTGFDDNRKFGLTGGAAAAPIWAEFMKCIAPFYPSEDFVAPPGVVYEALDSETGQLATPGCPSGSLVREVFVKGTEPIRACQLHGPAGEYDRELPDDYREAEREERPARTIPRRKRSFWDILFGE